MYFFKIQLVKQKLTMSCAFRLRLEERLIEEERKKLEEEQEKLRRESAKLESEKKRFEEIKSEAAAVAAAATMKALPIMGSGDGRGKKSNSGGGGGDRSGLAGALQEELKKRESNKAKGYVAQVILRKSTVILC
jgi:hypothetical protein